MDERSKAVDICYFVFAGTTCIHPPDSLALFPYGSGAAKKCGPDPANWNSGSPGLSHIED